MKKYILIISVFVSSLANAQTGPGGVGNSSTNPFWIDVHTNGGVNGVSVNSLIDYSGNNINAVQANVDLQPTYLTGAINGVDAVEFSQNSSLISGATSNLNSKNILDYYMFGQIDNSNILSIPFNLDFGAASKFDVFTGIVTLSNQNQVYGRNASGALIRTSYGVSGGYNMFQGTFNATTNTLRSKLNFTTVNTLTTAHASPPSTHESIWLGGRNTSYNMDGKISEAFVFNKTLNTAEDKIVKNYISAKFGTVIGDDMYDYESTHQFGVIGIGRDNASNSHLNSQGNGIVRVTSAGLTDGKYLFIGHDGVDLAQLSFEVPASITDGARFARVWRADEPSEIGLVTLVFDLDETTDFSGDPNNYRLLIDHTDAAADGFLTVDLQLTGTYNAGTREVTFTNVDLNAGTFFTLAGDGPQDIISVTSGPWTTPATWNCTCVPNSFDNVTVDDLDNVTLNTDASVVNFTVNPTGTLTWAATEQFDVTGNLTVNGVLDMGGAGVFSMSGAVSQTIDLGGAIVDFTNFVLNNSSTGVDLLNGTIQINGTLSPNAGAFDFSAGSLVINSSAGTTTGRVGPILSGATLSGNVTVKRFLPAGNAGEMNLCSPVIGADLSEWDAEIEISGTGFPDGCAYGPDGCYFSARRYDGVAQEYVDITSINEPLTNSEGIEIFIGTDLDVFDGATISSTGTLRTGTDFVVSVPSGWSIQGNPYASPILYSTLSKNFVGSTYFYVYDATSGGYQWYDQSNNSHSTAELANGVLAIGQGFWTNSGSNGNGTITYTQSDKTINTGTLIRSSELVNETIYLTLEQEGSTYKCISSIDFHQSSEDDYDSLDIKHLSTGLEKASSLVINSSEGFLRKQYLADNDFDKVVDLNINILNQGYYKISCSDLSSFDRYSSILLIDNENGEITNLSKNEIYSFYANEGEYDRFRLILSNKQIEEVSVKPSNGIQINEEPITISQIGNAINIEAESEVEDNSLITVTNLLGQEIIYSENITLLYGSNIVTLPSNFNGVYLVTVVSSKGNRVTKKIIL